MYKGSCHCGRVTFEAEGELKEAMECNCSHCSRKGYLLWFIPRERMRLGTPLEDLSVYHFNKHVIDHHFCPNCGCAPFGMGKRGDTEMAAINIRCLEAIELSEVKRIPVDGRSY
ncbi:GFA family protein [Mesorhizobium sp. CAU 1732]|uniref:GFA family protein n=1 Tax=Mesorhizobium sp. CAU 1732 TaxID=3140358 RepID=UPI0032613B97